MTDHPRFEPVKGPAHEAHQNYNGGRTVSLVFRLIDRWRGGAGAAAVRAAPALDPTSSPIEVRERPPQRAPSTERSARDELIRAHAKFARHFPDESFSLDFIMGSAQTGKLQAALLVVLLVVVLLAVTVTLVVLEFNSAGLSGRQTARHPGNTSRGSPPGLRDCTRSADGSPAHRLANAAAVLRVKSENRQFSGKLGIPPGSARFCECAGYLEEVRKHLGERQAGELAGLL